MSEIKWPPPVVNLPAAAVVEAPPDDVVAVVPAQAAGGRSKRRAFMLVVVVVLLGCGAVLVGRRGSNGSPSYSIAHAAVQLEDSKRLAFVGSAVLDSGETMTERFRIDVDRQLVQIDLLSGEKVNELGKTSTLADLDGQMFYVWHDDTPLQPAGWLGGRIDPGTARYYGAMLRFAPQTLAVAGRFRDAGLENQGIVDVDGERVTKYEVNIDADTLANNPTLDEALSALGVRFEGTLTYAFFVSKSSQLVKMTVATTVKHTRATMIYTEFSTGDEVSIEVPTEFHDMDAPLDSTP